MQTTLSLYHAPLINREFVIVAEAPFDHPTQATSQDELYDIGQWNL